MEKRINIGSGAPWEKTVGYSRMVVSGVQVEISGTVAVKDGKVIGARDPYQQTRFILEWIDDLLQSVGGSMENVVRTRIYVTDIAFWQEVGRAHGEVFRDIRPATSMLQVSALISPEYLVEIEATARLDNPQNNHN